MTLQIGEMAPDFAANSTQGKIRFYEWMGDSWVVLLTHRKEFTPVCAAELSIVEELQADFENRGCKFIGLGLEPVDDLDRWCAEIVGSVGRLPHYPLVAEGDLRIATLYDLAVQGGIDVRTSRDLVVIGPDRRIKLVVAYPVATVAIFGEVLRLIESLQGAGQRREAKIVNWRRDDNAISGPVATGTLGNGKPVHNGTEVEFGGGREAEDLNGCRVEDAKRRFC